MGVYAAQMGPIKSGMPQARQRCLRAMFRCHAVLCCRETPLYSSELYGLSDLGSQVEPCCPFAIVRCVPRRRRFLKAENSQARMASTKV